MPEVLIAVAMNGVYSIRISNTAGPEVLAAGCPPLFALEYRLIACWESVLSVPPSLFALESPCIGIPTDCLLGVDCTRPSAAVRIGVPAAARVGVPADCMSGVRSTRSSAAVRIGVPAVRLLGFDCT
jgi:hypothetical protein